MKGKQNFEMIAGHHRITAATVSPILLSVNEEPWQVLSPGNRTFTLKLDEACKLSLDPTDKAEYRFDVKSWETTKAEPTDNRPIPNPPPPNNFLKKLRVQIRREMGLTREDFAQRSSIYEVDQVFDDVPFEEQETQQEKQQYAERIAEAKLAEQTPAEVAETSEETSETPTT